MSWFALLSERTQALLVRALEDAAFRDELLADNESIFTLMGIPDEDATLLRTELFSGVASEAALQEKLSPLGSRAASI